MNDPIQTLADDALALHRMAWDLALDGQRSFQKQVETAFDVTRDILAFQRDQQVAWTKLFVDHARRSPTAS